jgi:hypothetical protein
VSPLKTPEQKGRSPFVRTAFCFAWRIQLPLVSRIEIPCNCIAAKLEDSASKDIRGANRAVVRWFMISFCVNSFGSVRFESRM